MSGVNGGRLENTLFYLVGFAGVGKYTVAKELAALTGARVVDNHYINNPIFGLIGQDGVTPLPLEVWKRTIANYYLLLDVVRQRGSTFIPVRLLCQTDELCRRVTMPDRRQRMKSIDAEEARRYSMAFEVFDPAHPNTLTLDTTTLEPHETAARILEHARSRMGVGVA